MAHDEQKSEAGSSADSRPEVVYRPTRRERRFIAAMARRRAPLNEAQARSLEDLERRGCRL